MQAQERLAVVLALAISIWEVNDVVSAYLARIEKLDAGVGRGGLGLGRKLVGIETLGFRNEPHHLDFQVHNLGVRRECAFVLDLVDLFQSDKYAFLLSR